jgi:hypothetical protein
MVDSAMVAEVAGTSVEGAAAEALTVVVVVVRVTHPLM